MADTNTFICKTHRTSFNMNKIVLCTISSCLSIFVFLSIYYSIIPDTFEVTEFKSVKSEGLQTNPKYQVYSNALDYLSFDLSNNVSLSSIILYKTMSTELAQYLFGKDKQGILALNKQLPHKYERKDQLGKADDITIQVSNKEYGEDSITIQLFASLKKTKIPATGISLEVYQEFNKSGIVQRGFCKAWDYLNGTYSVACSNYGVLCTKIFIFMRYSNFSAFEEHYNPWKINIYNKNDCFCKSLPHNSSLISWTIKKEGNRARCDQMLINDQPVARDMNEKLMCDCLSHKFNDIYMIGVSHIRLFADYIFHKCHDVNFVRTKISTHHKDINNIMSHYRYWVYMKECLQNIKKQLPEWLKSGKKSMAIWLQLGSLDFVFSGFVHGMEITIPLYKKLLLFISKEIKKYPTVTVDLRVIGTPPMPDNWAGNNFAIKAFNNKLRDIVREVGVEFTDMFKYTELCYNDVSPWTPNHYFDRKGNSFAGNVGGTVYFGIFLPKICHVEKN